ncbi:MAG: hypothetical protein H7A34_08230 [bacterium]|nr:hypothetical protein [bacterium]
MWGWWAIVMPLMLIITETIGQYRGNVVRRALRLVVGAGAASAMVFLMGGALSIPAVLLLTGYVLGGERAADWLLYSIDRVPIISMLTSNFINNRLSRISNARALRNLTIRRDVIAEVVESIGTRARDQKEFERMFTQRIILDSLEQSFKDRLRSYYRDVYGDDASVIESQIEQSLSKFAVDQRLRIIRKVYQRVNNPWMKFSQMFTHMMSRLKPGDKLEYEGRLGFIRTLFSNRTKGKLLGLAGVATAVAGHIFLLGVSLNPLSIMGLAMSVWVVLFLGTKTFEQTFGAVSGILLPLIHISLYGMSASFMPLVVIISEVIVGYMVGSTAGLLLKNTAEILYNFIINPLIVRPFRSFGEIMRIRKKNDITRQRLLIASVVPLIDEADSDLEFISKFDKLFLDTLDEADQIELGEPGLPSDDEGPGVPPGTTPPGGSPSPTDVEPVTPVIEPSEPVSPVPPIEETRLPEPPIQSQLPESVQLIEQVAKPVVSEVIQAPTDGIIATNDSVIEEQAVESKDAVAPEPVAPPVVVEPINKKFTDFALRIGSNLGLTVEEMEFLASAVREATKIRNKISEPLFNRALELVDTIDRKKTALTIKQLKEVHQARVNQLQELEELGTITLPQQLQLNRLRDGSVMVQFANISSAIAKNKKMEIFDLNQTIPLTETGWILELMDAKLKIIQTVRDTEYRDPTKRIEEIIQEFDSYIQFIKDLFYHNNKINNDRLRGILNAVNIVINSHRDADRETLLEALESAVTDGRISMEIFNEVVKNTFEDIPTVVFEKAEVIEQEKPEIQQPIETETPLTEVPLLEAEKPAPLWDAEKTYRENLEEYRNRLNQNTIPQVALVRSIEANTARMEQFLNTAVIERGIRRVIFLGNKVFGQNVSDNIAFKNFLQSLNRDENGFIEYGPEGQKETVEVRYLLSNIDLYFIQSMMGSRMHFLAWLSSVGVPILESYSAELNIADIDLVSIQQEARNALRFYRETGRNPFEYFNTTGNTFFFNRIRDNVLKNAQLQELKQWMADNMQLYYQDTDRGTLYVSRGISITADGRLGEGYAQDGIRYLQQLQDDLREAFRANNFSAPVLRTLDGANSPLWAQHDIWTQTFEEMAQNGLQDMSDAVLEQLNVSRVVVGNSDFRPNTSQLLEDVQRKITKLEQPLDAEQNIVQEQPVGVLQTTEEPEDIHVGARISNIAVAIGVHIKLNALEMKNLNRALRIFTRVPGKVDDQAFIEANDFISSLPDDNVQLTLAGLSEVNQLRRNEIQDAFRKDKLNQQEYNSQESAINTHDGLLWVISVLLEQETNYELNRQVPLTRSELLSRIETVRGERARAISESELPEKAAELLAESDVAFNSYIEVVNVLFDYHKEYRNKRLSDILSIANSIENSHSIADRYGLLPSLQETAFEGRISQEMYQSIVEMVFDENNRDFILLIASSRAKSAAVDDVEPTLVDYLVTQEIEPYRTIYGKDTESVRDQEVPDNKIAAFVGITDQETLPVQPTANEPSSAELLYPQERVNEIFRAFNPRTNAQELTAYLDFYQSHPSIVPDAAVLTGNTFFSRLYNEGFSPMDVYLRIAKIAQVAGLSIEQKVQLLKVLENADFLVSLYGNRDVILLDMDTFQLSGSENAGNQNKRTIIREHIDELRRMYHQNGREVNIIVFSEKLESNQMGRILGDELSSRIHILYGTELFAAKEAVDTPARYLELFLERIVNENVNRLNIKIFSNRDTVMNAAHDFGAILADRQGDILDALRVFGNLHPQSIADTLYSKTAETMVRNVLNTKQNYNLLGGHEFSVNGKPSPYKLQNFYGNYFVDQAA